MPIYKQAKEQVPPIPEGNWISVDPGDVHVGVTFWEGKTPVWAKEFNQNEFVDWLVPKLARGEIEVIVYEIFMLYHNKATQQTGSKFHTPELIGVMRHLARRRGIPFVGFQASSHKSLYKSPEYRPPRKALRDWVSYGYGGHCKDSECVGLWFVRVNELKGYGF